MSGLQWIRRRERTLARAVLPLVALAWLQVAAVPCVAAHQSAGLVAAASQESSSPGAGHELAAPDHAAHQASHGPDRASGHGPCPYCPPAHSGCDGDNSGTGRCAFPHDPQVDTRTAGLAFALPVARTSFTVHFEPALAGDSPPVERAEPVPRCPLTVSYCRFIE